MDVFAALAGISVGGISLGLMAQWLERRFGMFGGWAALVFIYGAIVLALILAIGGGYPSGPNVASR